MVQSETFDKESKRALSMMHDAGFNIERPVRFAVDEHLPFMGYTTFRRQGHLIVVAGRALDSGMIEGLLVHELSHVYRTEANHPSHNRRLLSQVAKQINREFEIHAKYQIRILQEIVDHVQDLYADDILFQVFAKSQTPSKYLDQVGEFFISWMKAEPTEAKNERKEVWLHLSTMLNNAFIISELERHHMERFLNEASDIYRIFLSKIDSDLVKNSSYFRTYMANLKEDVNEREFKQQLFGYMVRFIKLTVSSRPPSEDIRIALAPSSRSDGDESVGKHMDLTLED